MIMRELPNSINQLAIEVADFEAKIQSLEAQIEEIGQPAASELEKRLESLKIEERALIRNLEETLGKSTPEPAKLQKAQALFDYIRKEETSLQREADFLSQSNPSSAEVAARAASQIVTLCQHAFKRVIGKHHPLGQSAFVNNSEKNLKEYYGAKKPPSDS